MNTLSSDLRPALAQSPPPSRTPHLTPQPLPPSLPHELTQLILILAAHSLVISASGSPIDFPDPHLLTHLALVSPDNYTALLQFIHINVPWCSLHDAGRRGDLALMRWWLARSGMRISRAQFALALFEASQAGQVHVLEFWKAEYAHIDMDPWQVRHMLRAATAAGQVAAVEWWMTRSGFDVASILQRSDVWQEYVHDAMAANCLRLVRLWTRNVPAGHVFGPKWTIRLPANAYTTFSQDRKDDCSVLQWITHNVQDFAAELVAVMSWDSPRISLDNLAHGGYLTLLQWFLDQCRALAVPVDKVFTSEVLRDAVAGEHVPVLDWWVANELPVDAKTAWNLDKIKSTDVLAWIVRAGWAVEYSEAAVDMADSVEVLDWWLAHCGSGVDKNIKYTELAMDRASAEGRVDLLDWWLQSGCELKYSSQSLDLAAEEGHLDVLKWWLASELELKVHTPLTLATRGNHLDVMDWLWEHELYNSGAEEELAVFEFITCRNLEALRWWESRAWPTGARVIDRVGRKLWDDELDGGAGEVDVYGLRWWMCPSKTLDQVDTVRLENQWREWEMEQQGAYSELSDEDDEHSDKVERWWVDVEEEIPDFRKSKRRM